MSSYMEILDFPLAALVLETIKQRS
jgi:hypothetical protein